MGEGDNVESVSAIGDEPRALAENEARERILAYPPMTLLRIGWEIEPGRVQGQIYYRVGVGLGPTSRDVGQLDVLARAARDMTHFPHEHQRGGIEVLARPAVEDVTAVPPRCSCSPIDGLAYDCPLHGADAVYAERAGDVLPNPEPTDVQVAAALAAFEATYDEHPTAGSLWFPMKAALAAARASHTDVRPEAIDALRALVPSVFNMDGESEAMTNARRAAREYDVRPRGSRETRRRVARHRLRSRRRTADHRRDASGVYPNPRHRERRARRVRRTTPKGET